MKTGSNTRICGRNKTRYSSYRCYGFMMENAFSVKIANTTLSSEYENNY